MSVKLLTENHLEFLSSKGCHTGSSESTLVKTARCWKYRVTAHYYVVYSLFAVAPVSVKSCFALQYFVSFLVLQSSRWGRESCLLYFCCVLNVLFQAVPWIGL